MSILLVVAAVAVPPGVCAQDAVTGTPFRVDSDTSWIRVLAWPDGPLKRFGHHHVISHHGVSGTVDVTPDPLESHFVLEVSVADFAVDDPELRAQEGEEFEGEVPEKDIEGTRANMLGERLLDVARFPAIEVRSGAIEGSLPDVTIVATVVVKGAEQVVRFPASIELDEDTFVASGELELTHGELGLSPFTAMGGALSVRDLLVLKYRISGQRESGSE
jgi:hypothetical protein